MEFQIAVVGSGTGLKPNCVQEVMGCNWKVEAVGVETGVHEQPIGRNEIKLGATNRAVRALQIRSDAIISFGIESGIEYIEERQVWVDVACVIAIIRINDENSTQIEKWSQSLVIPSEWAVESVKNPDATYANIAQQMNKDLKDMNVKDPHSFLTQGTKSRSDYLKEAIRKVMDEYFILNDI
jgi:non-canonical (house-cleaning) NTP pyrophosphatase